MDLIQINKRIESLSKLKTELDRKNIELTDKANELRRQSAEYLTESAEYIWADREEAKELEELLIAKKVLEREGSEVER